MSLQESHLCVYVSEIISIILFSQGGHENVRHLYITIYWLSVSAIVLCDLLVISVFGRTLLGAGGGGGGCRQSAISTPHLAALGTGKRCDKHSTNSWKWWHLHRPITLNNNKTSRVTMRAVYCVWKDANTTDSMLPRRWCAAANVRRGSTPTALLRKKSTSQASGYDSGAGWCPRTSVRCRLISATWWPWWSPSQHHSPLSVTTSGNYPGNWMRGKKPAINCWKKIVTSTHKLVPFSSSQAPLNGLPDGTVVLGSSIIRDVDEDKLVNTKCVCIPGGCIIDLTAKVNTFPTSSKLRRLVLAVGGNDCDSRADDKPVPDILTEYESLIKSAQEISVSVTVSSICPRNKTGAVKERIEALNAGLKVLCDDLNADYVDNDPTFHLQDGSINDGYLLPDGTHLTKAATNKLVANLKLHDETSAWNADASNILWTT